MLCPINLYLNRAKPSPMQLFRLAITSLFTKYLFTQVALTAQPTGPWNSPLMITTSPDGQQFELPVIFQDSAGVPSLVRWKGDTLVAAFQWFREPKPSPTWDRVAVKFSSDNGQSWTAPTPILIPDLPAGYQRPFDPTLVVMEDQTIRMYFSSSATPPMGLDESVNTYSAISTDGIHYTFEPGIRVDHPTKPVIDPAVVRFQDLWHYTAPAGAPQDGARHYTSPDGLTFSEHPGLPSDNSHNWTGNLMLESSDQVRFYGAGGGGIWFSESGDAFNWGPYHMTNIQGGDPTVLKRGESDYLMIYVGPPGTTAVLEPAIRQEDVQVDWLADSGELVIRYSLVRPAKVGVQVYDLLGRRVASRYIYPREATTHEVRFPLDPAMSGMIFVRLTVDRTRITRKVVVWR